MLKRDVRVFQVVDERNALIELLSYTGGRLIRLGQPRLGTKSEFSPPEERSAVYWLNGVPTNRFSDGRSIELDGFYAVTGNRTYETDEGTNTVFVVEPFDMKPYERRCSRAARKHEHGLPRMLDTRPRPFSSATNVVP